MKFLKKLSNAIHARAASYVYFVLSVCAFVFLRSAVWTYGWIAELYPLGDKFVPTLLGIIALCIAVTLIYLIISAFSDDGKEKCKGMEMKPENDNRDGSHGYHGEPSGKGAYTP